MKKVFAVCALSLLAFQLGVLSPAVNAEADIFSGAEEGMEATAEQETEGPDTEEGDAITGDALAYNEVQAVFASLSVVGGNAAIGDPHFKAALLIQNTSPYAINNPTVVFDVSDKGYNLVAEGRAKLEDVSGGLTLGPGQSRLVAVEFESLVDVVPGQSTKALKIQLTDYIYAERVEDAQSFKKGVFVYVNTKPLNVKVADPHGWMYVPSKNLLEAAGYKYAWNAKASTFTAVKGKVKLEHKIGSTIVKVNGKVVKIDGGSTAIVNKTPMLSLNVLSEIASETVVSKGTHDEVTIVAIADKAALKA